MKNNFFKHSKIIIFLFIFIFCSCKEKERAEYNDIGQIDLESIACDSIKDMADTFPRIENYHDYKLKQVACSSNDRTYDLIYFTKDSLSRMDITLRDITLGGNDIFFKDAKQTFDSAKIINERTKISSLKGKYATVHFNTNDSLDMSKFSCILKEKYSLIIQIYKNKDLTNQDSLESFLKDFINKIDVSKLK
jgi:hypothetical protein